MNSRAHLSSLADPFRCRFAALIAVLLASFSQCDVAFGQTSLSSPQLTRLNAVAQRIAVLPWCEKAGYSVNHSNIEAVRAAVISEVSADAASSTVVEQNFKDREEAQSQQFQERLQTAVAAMKNAGAAKRQIVALTTNFERVCGEALKDKVFAGTLTTNPADTDVTRITRLADTLLEPFGAASWQTKKVNAQADVLYAVGVCQAYMSEGRIKSLTAVLTVSPGSRTTKYYNDQYAEGIKAAAEVGLDEAQCARVLSQREGKLKATR